MEKALALAALLRLAIAAELAPYVDPSQLDVPWPKHSHVKMPWRAFLETRPAIEMFKGVGVVYQHRGGSMLANLTLLRRSGFRCLRWEQPFGAYDPDTGQFRPDAEKRYRELLRCCRCLGITPLVLLNAHHGYPCKLKSWQRWVMADAPKGARSLVLDSVEGLRPVYSGLSNLTAYWAGEVLFTSIDPQTHTVGLSKPLPKALKKGDKVICADFRYLPAHPVGTPEFEDLAKGWVDYAREVCRLAKEEGVRIELEVWNELSFGSNFMGGRGINAYWPGRVKFTHDFLRPGGHAWEIARRINAYWPGRVKFTHDFLRPGGHAWEIARRTVEMAKKEFPGIKVIWGFSNTTFFHTPIEQLPPGIDGQSYHPYGTGWRELPKREQAPDQPWRCLEGFCPTYRICFAEGWAHTFIQCESLMHLLRPDKRLARKPKGTERFYHYITEHGILPHEAGVRGDRAALKLKKKFLLRSILFWLNKGIDRIFIFVSGPDTNNEGMGMLLPKCRNLDQPPPEGQMDPWLSPALLALRRGLRRFEGAKPIAQTRAFGLKYAWLGPERKVFEMPPGKPTLRYRDLFAVLPFQLDERRFVFAYYLMSPVYNVEDLAPTACRLSIAPLRAPGATLSCYDPLADRQVAVKVVERGTDALVVELIALDTPRLLIVEEAN